MCFRLYTKIIFGTVFTFVVLLFLFVRILHNYNAEIKPKSI